MRRLLVVSLVVAATFAAPARAADVTARMTTSLGGRSGRSSLSRRSGWSAQRGRSGRSGSSGQRADSRYG